MVIPLTTLGSCKTVSNTNYGVGLSKHIYEQVPLYKRKPTSVGSLTEAYIYNTKGLIVANGKLHTLCVAHKKCKK